MLRLTKLEQFFWLNCATTEQLNELAVAALEKLRLYRARQQRYMQLIIRCILQPCPQF